MSHQADVDNEGMNDTVALATITALAAVFTAAISAYDRRTLYRARTEQQHEIAEQLLNDPINAR